MKIKVMTYNIMSGRQYKNIDYINPLLAAAVIKREQADIIGLNEVHDEGGEFSAQAKEICSALGYQYYYFAPALTLHDSPYGNALISKYPIIEARKIMIEDPIIQDEDAYYQTRCIIKAKIDVGQGLNVMVSHFGLAKGEERNAVRAVLEHLEEEKTVLMGDFNAMPTEPVLEPLHQRLYDTAKLCDQEVLTFQSDNPYMKIDYIFTTKDVKVLHAGAIEVITSDHKPYYAEIEI